MFVNSSFLLRTLICDVTLLELKHLQDKISFNHIITMGGGVGIKIYACRKTGEPVACGQIFY